MREKIKGSHIDTETAAQSRTRRQQPGAQGAGTGRDALSASGSLQKPKLRKNQERLGVKPDHKTKEMAKQRRGTFP
jgi:hypothetical protein